MNFETVRKAYKELEREGLVSTERGLGTFASGAALARPAAVPGRDAKSELTSAVENGIKKLLRREINIAEIKSLLDETVEKISRESNERRILFAESNSLQAHGIAKVLKNELALSVTPVLLKDLKEEVAKVFGSGIPLTAVITTGFHINEVRTILKDKPVPADFVITNMSPETRRKLERCSKSWRFAFVCRDPESKYYKDILKAELGFKSDIACCVIGEKSKLTGILSSADVLLASPSVYETLKKIAPSKLPVFNVQDRVDPLSLKMLKDRMDFDSAV